MFNKKQLVALSMSAMLTVGMGMSALAASAEPNFTVVKGTPYTASITGSSIAEFEVGPANDWYEFVGYSSEEDAKTDTAITYNFGEEKIGDVTVSSKSVGSTYASLIQVTGNGSTYGAASLKASNSKVAGASVDLTVYVEASPTEHIEDADVFIEAVDVSGLHENEVSDSDDVTVKPAEKTANNPFHGTNNSCAQTYPTAGDALYSLLGDNFVQSGGYVSSVTIDEEVLAEETTEDYTYYGWNYCVVRNGAKAEGCGIVSAAVFEVKTGDEIYWAYGTSDQANEYFETFID